jgi:hypothetical protein
VKVALWAVENPNYDSFPWRPRFFIKPYSKPVGTNVNQLLQLALNQVSKLESNACTDSLSSNQPASRQTIAPDRALLFQPFLDNQV